jgi:hypothetical protein
VLRKSGQGKGAEKRWGKNAHLKFVKLKKTVK